MSSLRNSYSFISNQPKEPAYLSLTKNNDGININANEDYSVTGQGETRFYYEVPVNGWYNIVRFIMQVSIAGSPAITDYGNLVGGLTNGFDWYVRIKGNEQIITPYGPIKNNMDLFRLGNDNFNSLRFQSTDYVLTFGEDINLFGDGFLLTEGDRMGVILRDNFTGLIRHEFQLKAQAYRQISRS